MRIAPRCGGNDTTCLACLSTFLNAAKSFPSDKINARITSNICRNVFPSTALFNLRRTQSIPFHLPQRCVPRRIKAITLLSCSVSDFLEITTHKTSVRKRRERLILSARKSDAPLCGLLQRMTRSTSAYIISPIILGKQVIFPLLWENYNNERFDLQPHREFTHARFLKSLFAEGRKT